MTRFYGRLTHCIKGLNGQLPGHELQLLQFILSVPVEDTSISFFPKLAEEKVHFRESEDLYQNHGPPFPNMCVCVYVRACACMCACMCVSVSSERMLESVGQNLLRQTYGCHWG